MNTALFIHSQLVATKFFVPTSPHALISRPRLTSLLQQSLKHPLTLISAPAGFGKTSLLSAWSQSLSPSDPLVAWVSLDEGDNEPLLFWTYILEALNIQQPEYFTPLIRLLQSSQTPPIKHILAKLTNLLADSDQHFVLILDDYHVITEQQVHTTLFYLIEYLPTQLHIILSTRADPPFSLSQLRARRQVLEVRAKQLRCTAKETGLFFKEVMGIQFLQDTIQQVTARTEGWLVGLQLLALSLPECADPNRLLEEASGDQRYILDFLTDEVLQRQPQDIQTFLLSTSILERLNASLCNAVLQQTGSQQILQRLEQANLFVISLDNKREWYRYHALFAEALRHRLEQTQADLVPILHYRASLWYAEHDQITQAILHAFHAKEWQWAADLIERLPIVKLSWGASEHELILLRQWLEHLPADIVYSRPRLCLACSQLLLVIAPPTKVQAWLDAAEAKLTTSLAEPTSENTLHVQQDQQNLLGEVVGFRTLLQCYGEDGEQVLALCQQAFDLLSIDNSIVRACVCIAQSWAAYTSTVNDAVASIKSAQQAISIARADGQTALLISFMGTTAIHMIGAGRLHEAQHLTRQAVQLGMQAKELILPELIGWPMISQAEIMREWNQLDTALSQAEEAISLCEQTDESLGMLLYLLLGYAVLLRISLSHRDLGAAHSALKKFEYIGTRKQTSQPFYLHIHSLFTTIDQVRLWLACGELDRATRWAQDLDMKARSTSPFVREREEVGRVRILLAKAQPDIALQRLELMLQRATTGQRWGHVIEMQILQALAHQRHEDEAQALAALSEAVRLAEPEGYIRSFVDEGTPMEALLSRLREQQHQDGPTPYLDTLLAAFSQQNKVDKHPSKRARVRHKIAPQ